MSVQLFVLLPRNMLHQIPLFIALKHSSCKIGTETKLLSWPGQI